MSTTSATPATFTGNSSFSSSLAQTVARAVSFASLPMQQLQTQQTTIQNQQTALTKLTSDFTSLQTALDSINNAAGSNSFAATVDATAVATATVSSGAFAGTYSVNVLSTGSHTNTLSNNGLTTVTDPTSANIDASTTYTLSVGTQTYNISDSAGTLNGLAQAINSSGANVQATVVNIGSSTAPDYRLSVQGSDYSPSTIQLSDGTNSLMNTISTGTYVQYQVNGSTSTVNSTSRAVNLSTGLSVNLLATGIANITVAQSTSGIKNALSSFVSAYNAASADLTKSRGQNGGALAGQSIVYELENALQNVTNYAGSSGTVGSLSDVGITFDQNGQLQFDSSAFQQAANTSAADVINYFGTESGSGFLQNTSNVLTGVSDPNSGLLAGFSSGLTNDYSALSAKITADQDQINTLQTNLTNQMSTADAAISEMEQQLSYVTSLFSAQYANEMASGNG